MKYPGWISNVENPMSQELIRKLIDASDPKSNISDPRETVFVLTDVPHDKTQIICDKVEPQGFTCSVVESDGSATIESADNKFAVSADSINAAEKLFGALAIETGASFDGWFAETL